MVVTSLKTAGVDTPDVKIKEKSRTFIRDWAPSCGV